MFVYYGKWKRALSTRTRIARRRNTLLVSQLFRVLHVSSSVPAAHVAVRHDYFSRWMRAASKRIQEIEHKKWMPMLSGFQKDSAQLRIMSEKLDDTRSEVSRLCSCIEDLNNIKVDVGNLQSAASRMENLKHDLSLLTANVDSLQHTQLDVAQRIAGLFDNREITLLGDVEVHDALSTAISSVQNGVGSVVDVFRHLQRWVDSVEEVEEEHATAIDELQKWVRWIDDEIRRSQKYTRPPFK